MLLSTSVHADESACVAANLAFLGLKTFHSFTLFCPQSVVCLQHWILHFILTRFPARSMHRRRGCSDGAIERASPPHYPGGRTILTEGWPLSSHTLGCKSLQEHNGRIRLQARARDVVDRPQMSRSDWLRYLMSVHAKRNNDAVESS